MFINIQTGYLIISRLHDLKMKSSLAIHVGFRAVLGSSLVRLS